MITPPLSHAPYYLASPYTHPSALVREQRYRDLQHFAGPLMAMGYYVYAPILNTHPVADLYGLPVEFEWWEGFNRAFIERSAGIIVANIDGWRESRGVAHEIALGRELGLPIYVMHLDGAIEELTE